MRHLRVLRLSVLGGRVVTGGMALLLPGCRCAVLTYGYQQCWVGPGLGVEFNVKIACDVNDELEGEDTDKIDKWIRIRLDIWNQLIEKPLDRDLANKRTETLAGGCDTSRYI